MDGAVEVPSSRDGFPRVGKSEGEVGNRSTLCTAIHLLLLLLGKGTVIFGEWALPMDALFFVTLLAQSTVARAAFGHKVVRSCDFGVRRVSFIELCCKGSD